MAGIYQRSNINYPSILAAMAQARARSAEREGDRVRKTGEIWGNTVNKLGEIGARSMDYLQAMNESPEARLQKLEEERNNAIYEQQMRQRNDVNEYLMSGRVPEAYNDTMGFSVAQEAANGMDGYQPVPDMSEYAKFMGIYNAPSYGRRH